MNENAINEKTPYEGGVCTTTWPALRSVGLILDDLELVGWTDQHERSPGVLAAAMALDANDRTDLSDAKRVGVIKDRQKAYSVASLWNRCHFSPH